MSCLVVGLSHATAPFELVERVSLDRDGVLKMLTGATDSEYASEAIVLATCNRVEVYTQVDRFHGSVEAVSRLMAERTGLPLSAVAPHLYVHYDDGAVDHLFRVSSGLDSVAVGEAQILGQVRDALRVAQEHGTVGPALNLLFQQALRVAKRVHAETDIDRAAPSLVAAALDRSAELFGTLSDRRVVVVGAGSMGALVLATAHARGVRSFGVANRTPERAQRLADQYAADCGSLGELVKLIDGADVVVACAGAPGLLIDATLLESCARPPRVLIDLAMPHDIDPAVGDLGEITLIDLPAIAEGLRTAEAAFDLDAVREILADEVASFVAARRQASVT
ncbi:MAG: glutamyl-tRNA reductase, partial [Nocardioides sp.]